MSGFFWGKEFGVIYFVSKKKCFLFWKGATGINIG